MSSSIVRLLAKTSFKSSDCRSALSGQALPKNLGNRVARLCVVNGLRKHLNFALSAEVDTLCTIEGQEVFARARNAGLIMNDRVPDEELMRNKSWHPYCIWYPRVAQEKTYRQLATVFPEMRYQVGRACAVAGYSQLYSELDLLPDPCIAEEARENTAGPAAEGARQIFEQIMTTPIRFGVMNDYDRTVQLHTPKAGVCLNADTAVLATLKQRQAFGEHFRGPMDSPWEHFNITEDRGIDEKTAKVKLHALTDSEIALFVSPLPVDLPTMHKDLLILVAAFEGNLDRYARLRRPGQSINYELHCVVPGIYKSFAMASWLDRNPELVELIASSWHPREVKTLRAAINARWVMNNDIYRLVDTDSVVPDDELPYWIWYPTIPAEWTLLKLAEARAAMRPQCARACIAGGMRNAYTKIMNMCDHDGKPVAVDRYLMQEARSCPDHGFFEPDMLRRMGEQGIVVFPTSDGEEWKGHIPWRDADIGSTFLSGTLQDVCHSITCVGQDGGMYEGLFSELGRVRLYLSSSPDARARAKKTNGNMMSLEYEDPAIN
jgi:hypothetical protein